MRSFGDLRLTAVFISNESGRRLASAFVVTMPARIPDFGSEFEHAYLVTAKHVAVDAATRTARENLWVEFPWMGDQPLARQAIRTKWVYLSPEDLPRDEFSLDVAIGTLDGHAFTGHQIGESLVGVPARDVIRLRSDDLLGRETVSVGLFAQASGDANAIEPILRFGRVAALPRTMITSGTGPAEAVLVEGYAAEGMSGAPVFVRDATGRFELLGLHAGHFVDRSPLETRTVIGSTEESPSHLRSRAHSGVAIVTPAWRLWDLLESSNLARRRRRVENELRDFPWRFRDRRHREIRGVVLPSARFLSMSDHPEANRGHYEYLIHSPAADPYCTYGGELECNTHGAAELGASEVVKSAIAAQWPSVNWLTTEPRQTTGSVTVDGQDGEVTLYVDSAGQVRAIYLSSFWKPINWSRFREAEMTLSSELGRILWFADVVRGDYAVD